MTRLRMAEREVLDTLIDAGIARSRSEALAWCVRLVGRNQEEWIGQLREAMEQVAKVRAEGPTAEYPGRPPDRLVTGNADTVESADGEGTGAPPVAGHSRPVTASPRAAGPRQAPAAPGRDLLPLPPPSAIRRAPTLLLLHGWTASADLQFFTAYEALARPTRSSPSTTVGTVVASATREIPSASRTPPTTRRRSSVPSGSAR